jgi:hypothetical protein
MFKRDKNFIIKLIPYLKYHNVKLMNHAKTKIQILFVELNYLTFLDTTNVPSTQIKKPNFSVCSEIELHHYYAVIFKTIT